MANCYSPCHAVWGTLCVHESIGTGQHAENSGCFDQAGSWTKAFLPPHSAAKFSRPTDHSRRGRACQYSNLRAAVTSPSLAHDFYSSLLAEQSLNRPIDPHGAVSQAKAICDRYQMTLTDALFNKRSLQNFNCNDGIDDSIAQLLQFYSNENAELLNVLLRSF